MKSLIVFYSLDGNTEVIARKIFDKMNKKTSVDITKIETIKKYSEKKEKRIPSAIFSLLFRCKPKLKEIPFDPEEYDNIILGAPVWIGTYPPAIRSFARKFDLENKNLGLFCTYGSEAGNIEKNIKLEFTKSNFVSSIGFVEPSKNTDFNEKLIDDFVDNFV